MFCFALFRFIFFPFPNYNIRTLSGNWTQAEPSGCAKKCGVGEGKSGTPGAVTCDKSSGCDADTKPDAKQCPKTADCGTFGTAMSIVNRNSHLPLLHHHQSQPSHSASINQSTHSLAMVFLCSHLDMAELIKVFFAM